MTPAIPLGLTARDGLPDLSDIAATFDELADLALDHVEISAYAYDLVVGGRPLPGRVGDLVAACRDRPFGFAVHGPLSINFMGPRDHLPPFEAAARAFVEIAAEVGAPHLVLHAGMVTADGLAGVEDAYARQRDRLRALGEHAAGFGVTVCIENVFDWAPYVATPSLGRLAREIAAVDHPAIRATLDFSHGLIHAGQARYDFLAEAVELAPFAQHLHLHDSFGRPDLPWVYAAAEANATGMGDLHLPVGWGTVPWSALAQSCRFPAGTIATHELAPRFWRDRVEAIGASRHVLCDFRLALEA